MDEPSDFKEGIPLSSQSGKQNPKTEVEGGADITAHRK